MRQFLDMHGLNGLWICHAEDEIIRQSVVVLPAELRIFLLGREQHEEAMRPSRKVDVSLLHLPQYMDAGLMVATDKTYEVVSTSGSLQYCLVRTPAVGKPVLAVERPYHPQFVLLVA